MNIQDVAHQNVQGDRLIAIFNRQRELITKYQQIENMPEFPFNPHSRVGQKFFKDFAWRMTEELAEALEAYEEYCSTDNEQHLDHFKEEVIDALHFLVENLILIGITPEEVADKDRDMYREDYDMLANAFELNSIVLGLETEISQLSIYDVSMEVIVKLGLAMNCLKNKPWKQTEILTDVPKFHDLMKQTFQAFIQLCIYAGINDEDMTDLYFRKSEVNKFRQRSNY